MRILLGLLLAVPTLVFANADRTADPEPPPPDLTITAGPFLTVDAYCAFRAKQAPHDEYDDDITTAAPCPDTDTAEPLPLARSDDALRAYRFVELRTGRHLVIQTSRGWYGREIGSTDNGDGVDIRDVHLADVVRDQDAELRFSVETSHAPCGCDDGPYFSSTGMVVVAVIDDVPHFADPIWIESVQRGIDVSEYSATTKIARDGTVTRTVHHAENLSRKKKRDLAKPLRLRFLR